jgi:hypothetical protein
MRKVIAAQVAEKYKVVIEDREMVMLTPNEMSQQQSAQNEEPTA